MPRIVDLGCGTNKRLGALGVDRNATTTPDILHDLDQYPYPFADSSFDEIYLDNVLEHLADVVRTIEEVHRIGAPDSLVRIDVPYFRSFYAAIDPTHRHFFTVQSFGYFDPEHPFFKKYRYSDARFRVVRVVFNERLPMKRGRAAIAHYANRHLLSYETRISPLFPLDELSFFLRVLK